MNIVRSGNRELYLIYVRKIWEMFYENDFIVVSLSY